MPTRSLPHVFRRNGHHYLRIVVPAALRGLVGKRELRYSLRTGYHAEACRRGALVAASVKEFFQGAVMAELKAENLGALIEQFVRGRIDELATAYTNEMKNHIQAALSPSGAQPGGRTVKDIEEELNSLHASIAKEDTTLFVKNAESFLKASGYTDFQATDEFANFCMAFIAAEGNFMRYTAAKIYKQDMIDTTLKNLTDFQKYIEVMNPNSYTPQRQYNIQSHNTGLLQGKLSEVFEAYFDEQKKDIGNDYKAEIKSIFEHFVLIVGDVDTRNVTAHTATGYKETLKKMPRAWGRKNEFKGLSLEQIIKSNSKKVSQDTVNKHISLISSFFEYAVKHGYAHTNYFTGLKIKQKATRARKQRDMWSEEQLALLFSADNYPLNDAPHMFWLPIIAITTGARLGEIAQLRCCDVRSENGITYLDINDEDGKRLKNQQSNRKVPLNDIIVNDLNFLNFVDMMRTDDKSQLFPELYGFKSDPESIASNHFSKFKMRKLGIENPKINFHSLRHNARNMVPSNIKDDNMLNDYFGWEGKGEGNTRYRKEESIVTLYKKITQKMKIEFDFSALKSSLWVTSSVSIQQKPRKEKVKRFTWKK
ncbi:MAG: tyrosine-type recombinase/integrase [Humidesulfovibrio sp.]|uniref:DUF6538 domain-containing protein n=1 Tax=Humidesulfovibrio sp. TaxID=2910988 RepID=UPI0027373FE1|nr:DUF6538 domain-containing protein [Humidesulfovibrio sp.]MDP2846599.1 tyrosine-type recombinase/integrase [Humidesulfovibrio sp.]